MWIHWKAPNIEIQKVKRNHNYPLRCWFCKFWSLLCLLFISSFSLSLTAFLHLNNLHLFSLLFHSLHPSPPPLSPFQSIYFSFSRSFLPVASPSEGRLKGVIQPPRQLHITSCLRMLHSLSPLPLVCLPSSFLVCPPSASAGSSEYTEWVQPDAARHCCQIVTQITSIWSLMEPLSVNQSSTTPQDGFYFSLNYPATERLEDFIYRLVIIYYSFSIDWISCSLHQPVWTTGYHHVYYKLIWKIYHLQKRCSVQMYLCTVSCTQLLMWWKKMATDNINDCY